MVMLICELMKLLRVVMVEFASLLFVDLRVMCVCWCGGGVTWLGA